MHTSLQPRHCTMTDVGRMSPLSPPAPAGPLTSLCAASRSFSRLEMLRRSVLRSASTSSRFSSISFTFLAATSLALATLATSTLSWGRQGEAAGGSAAGMAQRADAAAAASFHSMLRRVLAAAGKARRAAMTTGIPERCIRALVATACTAYCMPESHGTAWHSSASQSCRCPPPRSRPPAASAPSASRCWSASACCSQTPCP
jgi:hypothetical protein